VFLKRLLRRLFRRLLIQLLSILGIRESSPMQPTAALSSIARLAGRGQGGLSRLIGVKACYKAKGQTSGLRITRF
jgi:hypothetical protein